MPSSVVKHTIPPFYACYFLRSLSSPGTTYIGSTPAPPRRKRQHNGDLTQGAYKTARARPWEMECIVYGFSSKIAALQFEWAWAKPHLSRHLKFHASDFAADGTRLDTAACVGMPLFPSTSMTPAHNRRGKPKRRTARPPSTPNARLLAMRALLRSEPFCGWGLKLAFFTEWSWLAYQRLEALSWPLERLEVSTHTPPMLRLEQYSRTGKPLHPLQPMVVCDFTGVDGKRTPLIYASAQQRLVAGIADHPVKKRQSSSKKKLGMDEAPQWPESLPRSANLKGLDACVQDFDYVPSPPPTVPSTDITKKAKRVSKADKVAGGSEGEEAGDAGDDMDADIHHQSKASASDGAIAPLQELHRMSFGDSDAEEMEWTRFEQAIFERSRPAATDASQAMSDFMQTCVQRYVSAQDARTLHEAAPAPTTPCALCHQPVDFTSQLDFVLCPLPQPGSLASNLTASSLSLESGQPCSSVFHLSCLADSFIQQQREKDAVDSGSENSVLPTHGVCPSCCANGHTGDGYGAKVALWADVVRAMYRRHERFERLVQFLARSGRSLAEHMIPPDTERTEKTTKSRTRTKTKSSEAVQDHKSEAPSLNDTRKKSKATSPGKRKQPEAGATVAVKVAFEKSHELEPVEEAATKTKRKASGTAKVAVSPPDVIDLT